MNSNFDFSYDSLVKILQSLQKVRPITSFQKFESNALILRFDVDYSLSNIVEIANIIAPEIESCTFFFLVSSDQYNLGGKLGKKIFQTLDSLGYEIGLHFDSGLYSESDQIEISKKLKKEINILEQYSSKQIDIYSLHNPSINGFSEYSNEYESTYDAKYFGPDKYRSDSRMKFPIDLENLLLEHEEDCFQLLLHPEHYGKDSFDYIKSMKRHFDFLDENLYQSMSINSTFVNQLKLNLKINND